MTASKGSHRAPPTLAAWAKLGLAVLALGLVVVGILLWRAVRDDPVDAPPNPFAGRDLGRGLVECKRLCDKELTCHTPGASECDANCKTLLEVRVVVPPCSDAITAMLGCWARASDRCGPEDACKDEVGVAWDCACAQPKAPAACKTR